MFMGTLHSSSHTRTDKTNISEKQVGMRGYRVKFPYAFGLWCRGAIAPVYLHPAVAFKFTGECLLQLLL